MRSSSACDAGHPVPADAISLACVVHPVIDRVGTTCWRLIGIGIVVVAALWLMAQLWMLMLAVGVAVMFSRALEPLASRLKRRGWPPALAAIGVMFAFWIVAGGIIAALVPGIAAEFEDLGPTIEQANNDLEDWLVEDSPFDVSRQDVEDFRREAGDRIDEALSHSSNRVVDTTLVVFEVITALVLATITSFFMLKDGDRFGQWVVSLLPHERRSLVVRLSQRAWDTLGGYLRGAAILGVVEGLIIGTTVWLAGGELAIPIAVITFAAAFIPFVGAIIAGSIAVLVTLVTSGIGGALVVLVVAILVQQFDNDLLAPFIYGRSLSLHPLVVLFAIAGGSALVGPIGTAFAVPVTAVALNVIAEARAASADGTPLLATPAGDHQDRGGPRSERPREEQRLQED
jgi:putative heme transporter